jgi:hypothetical protein
MDAGRIHAPRLRDEIDAIRYGGPGVVPWVARLGRNGRREFIDGQRDYMHADKLGNRGVFVYFYLLPGIYEINEPVALGKGRRYYARAGLNEMAEITREEALACLANGI